MRSCERVEIGGAFEGQTGRKIGIGRDRVMPQFGRPNDWARVLCALCSDDER